MSYNADIISYKCYIILYESRRDLQALASSRVLCYTTFSYTISTSFMYDDYDLDYTFNNDYNLDEDSYYEYGTTDLDEDYAREGQDYQDLAYRHYA